MRKAPENIKPDHPRPEFAYSEWGAQVILARLVGESTWIVGWGLPVDFTALKTCASRARSIDLATDHRVRSNIDIHNSTDCTPLSLPFAASYYTDGKVNLRKGPNGEFERNIYREVQMIANFWRHFGSDIISDRKSRELRLLHSSLYFGIGAPVERILKVDRSDSELDFETFPEVELDRTALFSRPRYEQSLHELSAWTSFIGKDSNGKGVLPHNYREMLDRDRTEFEANQPNHPTGAMPDYRFREPVLRSTNAPFHQDFTAGLLYSNIEAIWNRIRFAEFLAKTDIENSFLYQKFPQDQQRPITEAAPTLI